MKYFFPLFAFALFCVPIRAELSLVVQPINETERAHALASIGYAKIHNDTIYLFSHDNTLLERNCIRDIQHISYEERSVVTSLENSSDNNILVYPNPTTSQLVIKNANCVVGRIFDLEGKMLLVTNITEGSGMVDVSSLPTGTYLLLLNTDIVKFIKK